MNNNIDIDNFDKMLALAELGAKQYSDRRQVEFRIFISYITLLALAFYQLMKVKEGEFDVHWITIGIAVFTVICIHILYCKWQSIFHIASHNDVRRRDFYLKKAECLAHHLSQNANSNFAPSLTKPITVNLGGGNNPEKTEHDLFKQTGPDIFIPRKKRGEKDQGTPPPKWYKDWHNLFPTVVSTVLMLLLITALILKKANQL